MSDNLEIEFQHKEPLYIDGMYPCNYVRGHHGFAWVKTPTGNIVSIRESRLSKRTPIVIEATQTDLFTDAPMIKGKL